MKITIIKSISLFNLFPNLITKESYNWWITRRVWGFRYQISKAKYLKISRNVGRTYREASGEHRGTVQNGCETFRVSAIIGSEYVWPGKLKRSPLPSGVIIPDMKHLGGKWQQISGWKWKVENGGIWVEWRRQIFGWKWRQPGGMAAAGCITSGCKVAAVGCNSFPGGMCRIPYSLYSGFAYGFQRTLLNLGLLWWLKSYQNTKN